MSLETSIDLRIVENTLKQSAITPTKILLTLMNNGWNLQIQDGNILYLPIGDNDRFSWTAHKMSVDDLMQIVEEKEKLNELIGIKIRWQDTDIDGALLLSTNEAMEKNETFANMSLCLENRKILKTTYNHLEITDVNWYLERLMPIFTQKEMFIEMLNYNEYR